MAAALGLRGACWQPMGLLAASRVQAPQHFPHHPLHNSGGGDASSSSGAAAAASISCTSIRRGGHRRACVQARAQDSRQVDPATTTIADLSKEYCNEFECTSSPAVEQTIRQFASDLQARPAPRQNVSRFQPDVAYTDGFRSFTGRDKYERQLWYSLKVQKPVVTIQGMSMLDKSTARVDWRLVGSLGVVPVDIGVSAEIQMNLLTGRVTSHKETLDTSRCSPPAALAVALTRLAWSTQQASMDATQAARQKVQELFPPPDDGSSSVNIDPNDPTKFFQGNTQQDDNFNEAVSLAAFVAVLWLVYRTFSELEKLP